MMTMPAGVSLQPADNSRARKLGKIPLLHHRVVSLPRADKLPARFNERSWVLLKRVRYPVDVNCLVVLWRIWYKLGSRDLAEMCLNRGFVFTHEALVSSVV
jgi:hypothetical protein